VSCVRAAMYGDAAVELLRELRRSAPHTIPAYNVRIRFAASHTTRQMRVRDSIFFPCTQILTARTCLHACATHLTRTRSMHDLPHPQLDMARKLLDDYVPLALWMATGDTLWELAAAAHHRRVPSVPIVFHRYIQACPCFMRRATRVPQSKLRRERARTRLV
jgi:hypothetical protein